MGKVITSLYTRNIHIMPGHTVRSVFCFPVSFPFFFGSFYPMIRGEILIYVPFKGESPYKIYDLIFVETSHSDGMLYGK